MSEISRQRFEQGREIKPRQFRLLRHVDGNRLRKRACRICRGNRIGDDRSNIAAAERFKKCLSILGAWSQPARGLERGERLAAIRATTTVDLARREAGSIQKDLHVEL